ncbi:MAG TPA: cupin domain-containing protein [Polyangiaceae bacterium]|jgi:uncharacterized cupin superfamily protein|nr:cupin domain-containing protein [Polyangiaceae bacterium]
MPRLPALDPATIESRTTSVYPAPYDAVARGRAKRALTQALGLTQFGVNVTELAPGAASAHRHWHSHEDEFVFVLEGEPTLVTDEGEQVLKPGQCAGFAAGVANGHQLVNRSSQIVRIIEVGTRDQRDLANYPDIDLSCAPGRYDAKAKFTKKDGSPLG